MPLAPLAYRISSLCGLVLGKLTLKQVLSNFLPQTPNNLKEKHEVKSLIDSYFLSFLSTDYHLAPHTHETMTLLDSIVNKDQYSVKKFLKPSSVIFDVGANIGIFSIYTASLDTTNKIYAFEPVRNTYEILKKNISSYQNIIPFEKALGNHHTSAQIRTSSSYTSVSRIQDEKIDSEWDTKKITFDGYEEIEITTIDEVMKEQHIPRLDFLKIDTEGYEMAVLEGAKETIQAHTPVISLSAYHRLNDKKNIPDYILSLNPKYKYKIIEKQEEDFIFWIET